MFENISSDTSVTLINASTFDSTTPAEILTALFFNLNYTDGSSVALSPFSALISGSRSGVPDFDPRTIDSTYAGITTGIGSAGLSEGMVDLFGNANRNGPNLEGATAVNGGEYGITTASVNATNDLNSRTLDLTAGGAL